MVKQCGFILINKNLDAASSAVEVALNGFKASSSEAVFFDTSDINEDAPLIVKKMKIGKSTSGQLNLNVPQFSFVRITLKK